MIVLALFDGMSCGYEALKRAGVPITKYYASEIDSYAIQTAKKNHPDIIQLGDVSLWDFWNIEQPDLIIGGSPCQGFSFAGKQLAFDDPRSKLFFTMMDIIEHYKPRYKMLENVRMKPEFLDTISEYMGVKPHFINSELVSAQSRQRYYWYNWEAPDPVDKQIFLEDIVNSDALVDREKSRAIIASIGRTTHREYFARSQGQLVYDAIMLSNIYGGFGEKKPRVHIRKSCTIRTAAGGGHIPSLIINNVEKQFSLDELKSFIRKVTPEECERLQTLPDGYTAGLSNTQRYKMLGNGWTVDVIAHLFKHMIGAK